jgi:hypothetical protein
VEDGGFQVFIDQSALVPGEAVDLMANTAYRIELKATSVASNSSTTEFRGHFVRLGPGANSVETVEALITDAESGKNSKIVAACVSDGIAGFTHTDNTLKTTAFATLTFPNAQADSGIPLDVTIVVANCDLTSPLVASVEPCDPTESTYYYSQYIINFELASAPTPPTQSVPPPSAAAPTTTSTAAATAATTANYSNSNLVVVWVVFWSVIVSAVL